MSADDATLLEAAIGAALAGAREILEVYHGPFEVAHKADRSPVTEADRRSQEAILTVLEHRCPGIPVVSEEASQTPQTVRSTWTVHWLVDPLDGTKEFVARRTEFTVNIALIRGGYPHLGVVYVPVDRTLYCGSPLGSWRGRAGEGEGARTALPQVRAWRPGEVTAAVSRSHLDARTAAYLQGLESKGGAVRSVPAGSARKLCVVAEGVADVYPRYGPTMEWDTAAGQAVLEAAGGRMVDARTGERLGYGKPDLTNPPFIALAAGRDAGYFLGDLPSRPRSGT